MRTFLFLTLVSAAFAASAQNQNVYKSEVDNLVTVRSISIMPVFDNMRGIYSRPVEAHLIETLNSLHRFEHFEANVTGPVLTPDELEENVESRNNVATSIRSDAFIATSVINGPGGIGIKMSLFLKADQKLIAQEVLADYKRLDVESIKKQSAEILNKLIKKLPYSGVIVSRQGTRVTINLGKKDGITEDQVLSVIQVIKLVRHPKFHFLVSSEKEVIGKIKLLKVDDTLSFGRIVTEVEGGAIQVNAKLASLDPVQYTNTDSLNDVKDSVEALPLSPEGRINYGDNPVSWLPTRKPTFGMVGARIGIGQFHESISLTSGTSLESKAPWYPLFYIDGELWLTPVWSMHAKIQQGIVTTNNPTTAGASDLSRSLSNYEFLFGYNLRLSPSVNSAKIEALFGFSNYRLSSDSPSTSAITTKAYSGLKFGVAGAYPLNLKSPYSVGVNLNFIMNSKLQETPGTSGADDNTVHSFGFFVDKEISVNLRTRYALDFELFSSDFTGGDATSSSQKHTVLSGGIYYLF